MTLDDIVAEIDSIRTESAELAALDELTDEQEARFDELSTRFDELDDARIKAVERAEKVEAIRSAASDPRNVINTASTLEVDPFAEDAPAPKRRDPFAEVGELRNIRSMTELRERALDAVE